jgi:phosphotransferase system enzyme I (PtsI)
MFESCRDAGSSLFILSEVSNLAIINPFSRRPRPEAKYMNEINTINSFREETTFIEQKKLDINTIEILLGLRGAPDKEKQKAERIKSVLGDEFYPEIIYTLLHKIIRDKDEARRFLENILLHKKKLDRQLVRDVGLQVAALDYSSNIKNIFVTPTIIEEGKILEFARIANRDELTSAFDKGTLLTDLAREIERTKRYGSNFAVIFIDIDNMKQINDTYGHEAGDFTLKFLYDIMRKYLRSVDAVYRFGGDEFVVFLPNTNIDTVKIVARKLIEQIRENRITYTTSSKNVSFGITVSMGLEAFNYKNVINVQETLEAVDKFLYDAKKFGKNRIHSSNGKSAEKKVLGIELKVTSHMLNDVRQVIRGTPMTGGIAAGRAYCLDNDLDYMKSYEIGDADIEKEIDRVKKAVSDVKADLKDMENKIRENLSGEMAKIFFVHSTILSDEGILSEIKETLKREKLNAEVVVRNVFKRIENRFKFSQDKVVRDRSFDIADISRRIICKLMGVSEGVLCNLPKNRIIVAQSLLPSQSANLKKNLIKAVVTELGSKNSHAAILASGFGIPYVSETEYPVTRIKHGSVLIVDANKGRIIVNPNSLDWRHLRSVVRSGFRENLKLIKRYKNITLLKGKKAVRVFANVNTKESIDEAVEFGCDGIGLFRMEQIYMQNAVFPTREQLYDTMKDLFERVEEKEITVRLLDIGGDKVLPYLNITDEFRSPLGMRGVRVLLKYPKVLEAQLLALMELGRDYNIRILIPMVTMAQEVASVREHLKKCKKILKAENKKFRDDIMLGSLVEVPAAVAKVEDILNYSDFLSIGTNDLVQYIIAYAREIEDSARYGDVGTEIVFGYVRDVLAMSRRWNIDCSICGELAGNTFYTEKLLNLGLENFSVSPGNILKVKKKISDVLTVYRRKGFI